MEQVHVELKAPVGDLPSGYITRRTNINSALTPTQGRGLKRLAAALDREGACLASGQRVTKCAEALRWLLERYEAAAAEQQLSVDS